MESKAQPFVAAVAAAVAAVAAAAVAVEAGGEPAIVADLPHLKLQPALLT